MDFFAQVEEFTGDCSEQRTPSYYVNLLQKSWRGPKGRRSATLALAAYHYLQTDEDGLEIAHQVDEKLFDKTYFEVFDEYAPGGIEYDPPEREEPQKNDVLQLNLRPARKSAQRFHFANSSIRVLGRSREREQLRLFAESGNGFRWLQIAGEGGQGKSRLALDLLDQLEDAEWAKGFIDHADMEAFEKAWPEWRPSKSHLIVVDYVLGQEEFIGRMMGCLAERSYEFSVPVLILLLERQRWNRGELEFPHSSNHVHEGHELTQSQRRAEWFDALNEHSFHDLGHEEFRWGTGLVALSRLEPRHLIEIVKHSAGTLPSWATERYVSRSLAKIDRSGRPLFALLLGSVIKLGKRRSSWTKEGLLDEVLNRESQRYWKAAASELSVHGADIDSARTLVVGATMSDMIDVSALERSSTCLQFEENTIQLAKRIAGNPSDSYILNKGTIVQKLEPDILGEWFVIQSIHSGSFPSDLIKEIWKLAPEKLSLFLLRAFQDFPNAVELTELVEFLNDQADGKRLLQKCCTNILGFLVNENLTVPEIVLEIVGSRPSTEDATIMICLAKCYRRGLFFDRDDVRAFTWMKKAADTGNKFATVGVAILYRDGTGVTKDERRAFQMLSDLAHQGSHEAYFYLAVQYQHGLGADRDPKKAMHWYERALAANDAAAAYNLGLMYGQGAGVEANYQRAFEYIFIAYKNGYKSAVSQIGIFFREGWLGTKDMGMAFSCFAEAAIRRDAWGMSLIGLAYRQGEGTPVDHRRAYLWLKRAAKGGQLPAAVNLGYCYSKGQGVARNLKQAAESFRIAAAGDEPQGVDELGNCYLNGWGVPKNQEKAFELFQHGAELGYWASHYSLGDCFLNGVGCERDLLGAYENYRKAAEQGLSIAMTRVGLCLERGIGIEKNLDEALSWYEKAAQLDELNACGFLGSAYFGEREFSLYDPEKAVDMLERAIELGCDTSMYWLGCRYLKGMDLERNIDRGIALLDRAATQENSDALLMLSKCYELNVGVEEDLAKSFDLSLRSACKGNVEAMASVGTKLLHGEGVKEDIPQSVDWLRKASEADHIEAMFPLASVLYSGPKSMVDLPKAVFWFEQAVEGGDSDAMYVLALIRLESAPQPSTVKEAISLLTNAAELGNGKAISFLASTYQKGDLVPASSKQASYWLEKLSALDESEG